MIVGFIVSYLVLRKTSFGMRVYAVGGNRTAADVAGVKTGQILISVYVLSGAAGRPVRCHAVVAGHLRTAQPGSGYELDAIAAVVIGGASLLGGRGTIWGTACWACCSSRPSTTASTSWSCPPTGRT